MRTPTLLLNLLLLLTLFPVAAFGQGADDVRARELYDNGALLYEEGDYENAVVAWKEAYDLSERPLLLFNIANALERVGEWQEAFDYLNQYRAFAPTDEREMLDRRMRSIERRLEERRAEEAEERRAEETRRAEEQRRADEAAAAAAGTARGNTGSGPHPAPVILMGAGLAGVGVGGVFGGLAMTARNDAAGLCASYGDDLLCPDTARDALDRDRTYSLVSDISMIAGGAIAATGLVLSIVDATSKGKEARAFRIIPSGGPAGGSVVLVARF